MKNHLRFTLGNLFAGMASLSVGLAMWRLENKFYNFALATLSTWVIIGLLLQARDLWRGDRVQHALTSAQRRGWRFEIFGRCALAGVIAAYFVVQAFVITERLKFRERFDLFAEAEAETLVEVGLLLALCLAMYSGPPSASTTQGRTARSKALDGLGMLGGMILLALYALNSEAIPFLSHVSIASMNLDTVTYPYAQAMRNDTAQRSWFFLVGSLGVASLVLSWGFFYGLLIRWNHAGGARARWIVLLAASLVVTVSLAVWMQGVGLPGISPLRTEFTFWPRPHRAAVLAVVMLTFLVAVARYLSARLTTEPPTRLAPRERTYYHESRSLALLLGALVLGNVIYRAYFSGWVVGPYNWEVFMYSLFQTPPGPLLTALAFFGIARVCRRRSSNAAGGAIAPLAWGPFLLIGWSLLVLVVCSACLVHSWAFAYPLNPS